MTRYPGQPENTYTAAQLQSIDCGNKTSIYRRYSGIPEEQTPKITINNKETRCYPLHLLTIKDQAKVREHEEQQRDHTADKAIIADIANNKAILADLNSQAADNIDIPQSTPFSDADKEAVWRNFSSKPNKMKERAYTKMLMLDAYFKLLHKSPPTPVMQAKTEICKKYDVCFEVINNALKAVKGVPRDSWAAVLIPKHKGRVKLAECSPEAWEWFKRVYLRLEAPDASDTYRKLKRVAKVEGWQIPSCKTLLRRVEREFPRAAIILYRQGEEAALRTYPAQKRDKSVFTAMQAVNADGHKFDVFVKWEDGTVSRPLVVVWQDIMTAKILSWRVDRTENKDAVRLSFGDMAEKFGIPEEAYLDNGRGFASKWITGGTPNRYRFKVKEEDPAGILTILGVNVHWCQPYHGQSKPIERAFLDFCQTIAKDIRFAGAYTGNNPTAKPENYGSTAIPIDKFMTVLNSEIHAHNQREGRRSDLCMGKFSFDQIFNESYAKATIRKITADQRRFFLLAAESVTANATDATITLSNNRYWHEKLAKFAGEKLVVRFDPQNMHGSVSVELRDGRLICEAQCIQKAGFNDSKAAREHARLRNQNLKSNKEIMNNELRMTALEAEEMLPYVSEGDLPQTKVVGVNFNLSIPETVEDAVPADEVNSKFDSVMSRCLELQMKKFNEG